MGLPEDSFNGYHSIFTLQPSPPGSGLMTEQGRFTGSLRADLQTPLLPTSYC